ncbi:MAG: hypothetical protein WBL63_08240, partial [Candidatus Acidiferrum sp.]
MLQNRRVVDCEGMGNSFDFSVEKLTGAGVPGSGERTASEGGPYTGGEGGTDPKVGHYKGGGRRTFYLETFGCQMNEHDSEKVAGVLLARGYRQVETVDEAGVVLYNTCSIREKAAQKVYSRLGEFRPELVRERGEERIPQGLKPALPSGDMSDLKVRPPKEKKPQDPPSQNEDGAPALADSHCRSKDR